MWSAIASELEGRYRWAALGKAGRLAGRSVAVGRSFCRLVVQWSIGRKTRIAGCRWAALVPLLMVLYIYICSCYLRTPFHLSTRNMKGPQSFPHGLDFTNDVATYMGQSFRRKLDGSIGGPVKFPDYWSLEFLGECNLAVEKIVSAYRNKRETFIFLFSLLIISVTKMQQCGRSRTTPITFRKTLLVLQDKMSAWRLK